MQDSWETGGGHCAESCGYMHKGKTREAILKLEISELVGDND
jgi:hypothetical protein